MTATEMSASRLRSKALSDEPKREEAATTKETATKNATDAQSLTKTFFATFSWTQLLDPSQPWVLVPNGSLGGHFDWVPIHLRTGPWSAVAICYWTTILYLGAVSTCYILYSHSTENNFNAEAYEELLYPPLYSIGWWYHTIGCLWMLNIMRLVLQGPFSYKAWSTYTVQSWTLLCFRHALCALTPWYPTIAVQWAEVIRFPVAVSQTVTFAVWNFMLFPFVALHVMKDKPVQRANFIRFCTSFRLTNLHVLNILLCIANVWVFSPPRVLGGLDFYASCVSLVCYLFFYFCVLDRLGIHFYPAFSPRDGKLVLVCWTAAIGLYVATFYGWRYLLLPPEQVPTTMVIPQEIVKTVTENR